MNKKPLQIKLTTDTGDYWFSKFNGTVQEAMLYYLGQTVQRGYTCTSTGLFKERSETITELQLIPYGD